MAVRGTFATDDGRIMRLTLSGSGWLVEEGSIRKSARLAEALSRVDGTDDSALARAFQVVGSRPGSRLHLGAPDPDMQPDALTKAQRREGETLDEAWERIHAKYRRGKTE